MNAVIGGIEGGINWIVDGLNRIIGGFNKIVTVAASIIGADWGGADLLSHVSLGRISVKAYADGGFPEDGLFFANHSELVGKFSNGKTAVANNMQIIEGIAGGVSQAINDTLIPYIREIIRALNNGGSTTVSRLEDIFKKSGFGVRRYATGGFPEDGWFRASHGEIMGQFDNGQSVVADNQQITEGISLAVQAGNQESNMLMRQNINLLQRQNDLLMGILQKETGISRDMYLML